MSRIRETSLPALVIQSLGDTGVFPSDAQTNLRRAGFATDKKLEFLPGAHYFEDNPAHSDTCRRSYGRMDFEALKTVRLQIAETRSA